MIVLRIMPVFVMFNSRGDPHRFYYGYSSKAQAHSRRGEHLYHQRQRKWVLF